jgi:hypothetical protein
MPVTEENLEDLYAVVAQRQGRDLAPSGGEFIGLRSPPH